MSTDLTTRQHGEVVQLDTFVINPGMPGYADFRERAVQTPRQPSAIRTAVEEFMKRVLAPAKYIAPGSRIPGDVVAKGLHDAVSAVQWDQAGVTKAGLTFDQALEEVKSYALYKGWFQAGWLYVENPRFFTVKNGRKILYFAIERKAMAKALSQRTRDAAADEFNRAVLGDAVEIEENQGVEQSTQSNPPSES